MNYKGTKDTKNLMYSISIFYNSPLERGDKGVCRFAATHPRPLFLEGSLKVAAKGSLIKPLCGFVVIKIK
ncbi:MAG: hypothetical protein A3K50_02540 [Planctomycetes bacterium RIFOXYD12_FULL_42_12]|nr:MAG: hypothetical protein A3K50_02540 [Planctomycetes bacterium RIFOXYD12_FULL_42_12]